MPFFSIHGIQKQEEEENVENKNTRTKKWERQNKREQKKNELLHSGTVVIYRSHVTRYTQHD